MTSKFRRTLSMEDLVNASDDEMDNLLSMDRQNGDAGSVHHHHHHHNIHDHLTNVSSDSAIVELGDHFQDVDHFLNDESSSAPVLHLSDGDGIETKSLPRSKSVRFQEPEANNLRSSLDNYNFQSVRNQVEDVKGIMKDNVSRLLDREAQLDALSGQSEQLTYSSDIYRQSSEMLRRKLLWRQVRTRLFLSAIGVICIFLILIPLITRFI